MKSRRKRPPRTPGISDRYLRVSGILLFCGILLTGVVMICSAVATYTDTVRNALLQNCDALTANMEKIYSLPGATSDDLDKLLRTAEMEYGYRIWVFREDGTECYPDQENGYTLPSSIRYYVESDNFNELGYYTNNAEQQQLCCVMPFHMKNADEETRGFYLAAVSDAGQLQEYSLMLVRSLVICLLLAMLLFMLLFRFAAAPLDRQLEEVSKVAKRYAEGEFSARVSLPEHSTLYPFGCTLNRMAEFIEQNESTRRNFVANVSHELRTPMTTIAGFADGILDGTIPPDQHQRYLRIIADEIHRLHTLVNSMLNLTKFEAGEMSIRISNTDVAKLLIKTVLMFEKRISDKHVEVEGLEDISLVIKADEDLLFQVLYNLIENAVKFVNEGGTISFSLREEEGMTCIAVKNTGEGLDDDELPKIFDRFYKTDASRSKDKTGLGLGLSIARKIVHLHGGHIVVKSVKGEYTCFEVQLPVNGAKP